MVRHAFPLIFQKVKGHYMEKLLNVIKVAELLGLHPESIRRLCRAGRIPYLKVAGRLRFAPRAIEAWLSKRSVPA